MLEQVGLEYLGNIGQFRSLNYNSQDTCFLDELILS